jgi:hypothetical protein
MSCPNPFAHTRPLLTTFAPAQDSWLEGIDSSTDDAPYSLNSLDEQDFLSSRFFTRDCGFGGALPPIPTPPSSNFDMNGLDAYSQCNEVGRFNAFRIQPEVEDHGMSTEIFDQFIISENDTYTAEPLPHLGYRLSKTIDAKSDHSTKDVFPKEHNQLNFTEPLASSVVTEVKGEPRFRKSSRASITADTLPQPRSTELTRVPHYEVERKYREGLNAAFERLRNVVPTLPQGRDRVIGAVQPSKGMIIAAAIEYMNRLEIERSTAPEELVNLKDHLQARAGSVRETLPKLKASKACRSKPP